MFIFEEEVRYAKITSKARGKVRVKGVHKRVVANEVIKELETLGVTVQSERTLQRYVKEGLIPVPERKSAGRGLGKTTDYTRETPAEFYASHTLKHEHRLKSNQVARCREKGLLMEQENNGLGLADWFYGGLSPEEQIEAGFGQTWLRVKHLGLRNHNRNDCQVCKNLKAK